MAKLSSINKNNRRIKLSKKYYARRKKLKYFTFSVITCLCGLQCIFLICCTVHVRNVYGGGGSGIGCV